MGISAAMGSGGSKTGLVLVKQGTSSGTATVNITNCFSSLYDNYRIIVNGIEVSSVGREIRIRFMEDSTANTVANYNSSYTGISSGNASVNTYGNNETSAKSGAFIDTTTNTQLASFCADIYNPNQSKRTHAICQAQGFASPNSYWRQGGFEFYGTTSFNGIQLLLDNTGNIACTYAVYGYNK